MRSQRWLPGCLAIACLGGCMVGPNYQRPDMGTPDKWAEATRL